MADAREGDRRGRAAEFVGACCPLCGWYASDVLDSRPVLGAIRRRRKCAACGARFTTYERCERIDLAGLNGDGI